MLAGEDELIDGLFEALFRGDFQAFRERLPKSKPSAFAKIPGLEKTRTTEIAPEFAKLSGGTLLGEALTPGPLPTGRRLADVLALVQFFTVTLEPDKNVRMAIYFFLSLWIANQRELFTHFYKQQFGNDPVEIKKACAVVALLLDSVASAFRGRSTTPKGRVNTELVDLVKLIREHEKEPLSPAEMREALLSAGVTVPEGDTFRLWLWRTEKKKLIPKKAFSTEAK
jgi:hypothetical protein